MSATFRQLQLFLALAEHGSITAAARACHVTQPTVSMQLKDLAEAVGLPLYEQLGKRLHPTAAGHALVKSAQGMSDEWSAFEQKIAALKGMTQGPAQGRPGQHRRLFRAGDAGYVLRQAPRDRHFAAGF